MCTFSPSQCFVANVATQRTFGALERAVSGDCKRSTQFNRTAATHQTVRMKTTTFACRHVIAITQRRAARIARRVGCRAFAWRRRNRFVARQRRQIVVCGRFCRLLVDRSQASGDDARRWHWRRCFGPCGSFEHRRQVGQRRIRTRRL